MDDTNIVEGGAGAGGDLSTHGAIRGQEDRIARSVESAAPGVNHRHCRRYPSVGVHKLQARTINAEDSLIPVTDVGCGKVNGQDRGGSKMVMVWGTEVKASSFQVTVSLFSTLMFSGANLRLLRKRALVSKV